MWLPHELRSPYVHKLVKHEIDGNEGMMEFDGYFYIEDKSCPVERILCYDDNSSGYPNCYHIEIYEKNTIKDTSNYGCDNDNNDEDDDDEFGGRICFFPTAMIRLKYRVLEKIKGNDEMKCIFDNIMEQQEEFEKRDIIFRTERSVREMNEAAEIGRKIDYKAWFAELEEKKKAIIKVKVNEESNIDSDNASDSVI
jgi:hypothetical protein